MKIKLLLLMLSILIITQGCVSTSLEESKVEEKAHIISDFSEITIGMTHDEVIQLIGEPTDSIGSGIVWQRYKLADSWYVKLLFLGENETLIDIRIVDYSNEREFVLKQDE